MKTIRGFKIDLRVHGIAVRRALLAAVLSAAAGNAQAAATNVNYIGGGGEQDWFTPANWEGGIIPTGNTYQATIAMDTDVTFTNAGTAPYIINRIMTAGTGCVTLGFGMINPRAGSGFTPISAISIGVGGARLGALSLSNSGGWIETWGNLKAASTRFDQNGYVYQRSGTLEIAYFRIANGDVASRYYTNWHFINSSNMTLSATWQSPGTIPFYGTPTFDDGRPKWELVCHNGGSTRFDLRGHGIFADSLKLTGTDWTYIGSSLVNTNSGGWVDANSIAIGTSTRKAHFLDVRDFTMTLRGAGTIYYNYSTNYTVFRMTNNTVTILDPAGGTASLHSGSDDRGADGVQPADWEDNFAFDVIRIGEGDTITLIGTANRAGGTNAVYATQVEGLGTGGTINLNNHNLYVKKAPLNVTFDTSLGGRVHVFERDKGTLLMIR